MLHENSKVSELVDLLEDDIRPYLDNALPGCGTAEAAGFPDWTLREYLEYAYETQPVIIFMVLRIVVGKACSLELREEVCAHISKDKNKAEKMLLRCKDLSKRERTILRGGKV